MSERAELEGLREQAPKRLLRNVVAATEEADGYVEIEGPRGPLLVAFNERGISCIDAAAAGVEGFEEYFVGRFHRGLRPATEAPRGLARALASGNARHHVFCSCRNARLPCRVRGRNRLVAPHHARSSQAWLAQPGKTPKEQGLKARMHELMRS
jgi:hypothetical protein